MASFATPFPSLVCMHTNHLATKRTYYSRLLNKKYIGCMETGRVCHSLLLLTRCLNRAWSMILQPILHASTEEACEDRPGPW